jgi:hypothetical protein
MAFRQSSFAANRNNRRSSLQFGDFPTFEAIKMQEKSGIEHVLNAEFWFYFRVYLPFIALVAFLLMFLVPLFIADNDDGYAFFGSLLSLVSSGFVVLSFYHVVPWRRHPSSLMLQISITSIVVSLVVIINAFPGGKYFSDFNDGGLNLIGSDAYASRSNRSAGCQTMSFFVQLALLAREMWVFSLSLDLVTSITNPFSSYRASLRKYHTCIWSVALVSATLLVNQPACQGQFMADGTCWIKISGSQSPCFWGYFLGWVILFYLFSVAAMLYAYFRISKGLESTYATRYACVADTFRVVFFYFAYCVVFYFFLSFVYLQPEVASAATMRRMERAYAYFIACRGFFDALVWFFSHGFGTDSSNGRLLGGTRESDGNTARGGGGEPVLPKTLTMADIVPPKPLQRSVRSTLRAGLRCMQHLVGCSCGISTMSSKSPSADHTTGPADDEGGGKEDGEVDGPKAHLLHSPVGGDEDEAEDEEDEDTAKFAKLGRNTVSFASSSMLRSSEGRPSTITRSSHATSARQSQSFSSRPSNSSSVTASVHERMYISDDIDLSPQLNMALRAELLYLVTMGIKESVLRLDQRELQAIMSHCAAVAAATAAASSASHNRSSHSSPDRQQQRHRTHSSTSLQGTVVESPIRASIGNGHSTVPYSPSNSHSFDVLSSRSASHSNLLIAAARGVGGSHLQQAAAAGVGAIGTAGTGATTAPYSTAGLVGRPSASGSTTLLRSPPSLGTGRHGGWEPPVAIPGFGTASAAVGGMGRFGTEESSDYRIADAAAAAAAEMSREETPEGASPSSSYYNQYSGYYAQRSIGRNPGASAGAAQTGALRPGKQVQGAGSYSLAASSHTGNRIHYILKSLVCGVLGTHMPGEYGVDPIAASVVDELYYGPPPANLPGSVSYNYVHPAAGQGGASISQQNHQYSPPSQYQQQQQHLQHYPGSVRDSLRSSTVSLPFPPPHYHQPQQRAIGVLSAAAAEKDAHSSAVPENKSGTGERSDSNDTTSLGKSSLQEHLLHTTDRVNFPVPPVVAPAEVIFDLNEKHQFRDFRPATFRKLRQMCGLSEEHYLELISQPTKERLSEGASGAFFFYCGAGELVVKTVEKHEAKTLLKILDTYLAYLQKRSDSLLVRFLGLHSISMYGNEFTFVVMKNIFPSGVRMNDKYDIKGSWVNRHGTRKDPGKRATCKYCNEMFVEGSSGSRCPEVVGGHEAVVTLKDNDMINKIRLFPDHAYALIDILNSDSDALCSMGMMDYSLLVGVTTVQYEIDALSMQPSTGSFKEAGENTEKKRGGGLVAGSKAEEDSNMNDLEVEDDSSPVAPLSRFPFSSNESRPSKLHHSTPECSEGKTENTSDMKMDDFAKTEAQHSLIDGDGDDSSGGGGGGGGIELKNRDPFLTPGYPARAVVAPSTYYLGVIDVLQTWSWQKRLEQWFKIYILQQSAQGISCLPPEEYKRRYQKKMTSIIEHSIYIREVTGSWRGKR